MRSATIFGLMLAAACIGCGARNVPSEGGSQAGGGDQNPLSSVGGSIPSSGTAQAGTGGRGGVPSSTAGAGAGSGVLGGAGSGVLGGAGSGVLGGAAGGPSAGTGGSNPAGGGGRVEASGSAGGSEKSGSGGAQGKGPLLPYPQGDPTPVPLPARQPGTALLTDTVTQGEKDRKAAGATDCQCMVDSGVMSADNFDSCSQSLYTASPCGSLLDYQAPPIYQCCVDILNSTSLADATIQCQAQATAELATCVAAAKCHDPNAVCRMRLGDALRKCPPFSYDLDATIQKQCYGRTLPPPMVCDDGTRLDSSRVCDRNADCSHGEDERSEYCKAW